MPINTQIHNTGGAFRFIDYVSLLPEFLREENDVVTLLQIFSDYLNNAYRNIKVSNKFEFKLISSEGMVGTRKKELSKLRDLFLECERKNLPILYLIKSNADTNLVVEYDGNDIIPDKTIIPWHVGLSDGDKVYVNYLNYPERSGVYYYDIISDKLIKDPEDFSQDIFSDTPDKPQMSCVGYVPRMIQFYPHDVGEIKSRKIKRNKIGNIYYEVYFTASISEKTDLPSVGCYNVDDNKYLVDYYNYLGNNYPNSFNYGKFSIYFHEDNCIPWNLKKGIFYAKDLTLYDTRDVVTNFNGENIYIDPSFKYKRNKNVQNVVPDDKHLFFNKLVDSNVSLLKIEYESSTGIIVENDYVNRLSLIDEYTFSFNNIDVVENLIHLNFESNIKNGDWVLFELVSGNIPNGLINLSFYKVERVYPDKKSIKLSGVDITNNTIGVGKLYKIKINFYDVGVVKYVENSKIVYKSHSGDLITGGDFVVVRGNKPTVLFKVNNNIKKWDLSSGNIYYVNDVVFYKGNKYKVLKTVDISQVPDSPDNNLEYYKIDMDDIIEKEQEMLFNPYMFGAHKVKRLKYGEKINCDDVSFGELYETLYVSPTEDIGIYFTHMQRDWIFNPRIAKENESNRNGWFVCYKSPLINNNFDLSNENSTQLFNIPQEVTIQKNTMTIVFSNNHFFNQDDFIKIKIENSLYENLSGVYSIKLIPNKNTLVINLNADYGNQIQIVSGIIKVSLADHIQNGAVIFSRKNLFGKSDLNPDICPNGYYYKFVLNEIEWSKYSKRIVGDVVPLVDVGNIIKFYGEYSVPLLSNQNQRHKFNDGDVVYLVNQSNIFENGYYRVRKNEQWKRLDDKLTIKVRNIMVDAQTIFDENSYKERLFYNRYEENYVDNYVLNNKNSFKLDDGQLGDVYFIMPVVDKIDTTKSYHKIYDAKYDSNTIAKAPKDFIGVPDMKYPIAEKIERLIYNKDPNVIDYDVISYLARFMGYDITLMSEDIAQSELYTSDDERKMALRKFIQYLPEFNALKSTSSGLEMLMLMFGIVGKIITLWTESSDPYKDMIPSDKIDEWRYSKMDNGEISNLIPTPHFMVNVEVDGNFPIEFDFENMSRLKMSIINYKPINTVFDGIISYLKISRNVNLSINAIDGLGGFQADVGYNIDFNEISKNCLI